MRRGGKAGSASLSQSLMSGSVNSGDPYYVLQDQLRDTIEKVVISFEEWKTLLQSTNTVNDPQYLHSVKQLKSGLKGAKKSLKVLDDTVTMVVKRREDFSHINDAELKSRQEFCAQCKERLESVKAVTRSQATADKLAEDAERTKLEDLASAREMASRPGGNSQFIDRQQKSQSDIISEQDDALARIDEGVQRLHQRGLDMGDEIRSHNDLLTELDADMDRAQAKMNVVTRQLAKLLKTGSSFEVYLILGLAVVAMVLLLVLVFVPVF